MPPFVLAALPALFDLIPKLGAMFGGGTKVAERNMKAVSAVVETAKTAIGAANEQELVERIKADPAAAAAVKVAVENWIDIVEAGSGGIDGARKADAAARTSGDSLRRSPSFLIGCMLLPLVYMIVANVVGILGKPLSDEVRSAISNGVVGLILGGLIGYYYGQTTSRNRTPTEPSQ